MPTCTGCGASNETADLDRHELDGLLVVRCPDCHRPMGVWRDRGLRSPASGDSAGGGPTTPAEDEPS